MSNKGQSPNVFELKGINQSYKSKKGEDFILFQDLNLVIEDIDNKGQFAAFMGVSGCGKSTILRYITGLQEPTSGQILINGSDQLPHIPMVFQSYSSLEWYTVLENVMLPFKIHKIDEEQAKKRAMEIIEIVGLKGHEHKYAKSPLLSGGQLQRVAIARSLVANPSMIVLDEPFSGLDVINRRKMQDFLHDLFHKGEENDLNPTFILVTHDSREAAYLANDIFIMDANPGRIKEHIKVNFTNRENLKQQKEYLDLVAYIDSMI